MRFKCVANPDGHLRFGGKRQHVRMKNLGAAGGQGVRLIIAQVVEKFGFGGDVGIVGINSVHIGPDDELFSVHYVGDDRAGKIGAVAAERGDAAVGSGADETGNDGNEAVFEKRKENFAATLFGFFQTEAWRRGRCRK